MQLLAGLNLAQRAAVTSPASVLQVLAPPGSGKTKTLTCRVAYLISHYGHNPQNVICCTFTIKAAREMRERLRGLVGDQIESRLVLGTIHSICRRYLVAYGHLIRIPKGFGIADTSDTNSIIKRICKRLSLSIEPKIARARISSHKAKGKTLEDLPKKVPKELKEQEFITVFHEYETALATSKLLDYDDLLLRCVDLLRAYPACVSNVEALLIDEFQDTNIVQFELMKLFASANRKITIVGDPDQSIYGFRAAEIENLNRMRIFYLETVVINLEENYRSTSAVLKLAQDVIEQDENRPQKKMKATHCHGTRPVLRRLPNPNEEALWIASEIKRTMTMTGGLLIHSDFAILLRSAYLSLLIERALTNAGIPYRMVGGQRFFDRVEIRIIIDYLRTISHPENNQAFLAIVNTPSRKIGETAIAEMLKLGEENKLSLWLVAQKVVSGELKPTKKLTRPAEQELTRLLSLIKAGRQMTDTASPAATVPSKLIDFVVKSLDYENYLKKKYKDDHEDRIENVKELVTHASEVLLQTGAEEPLATIAGVDQVVSNGGQEVLAQFLANIVLSTDVETEEGNDKPRVTISTIHSAKGLEWPVVFIPAIYEGSIPHSRAENTDEERRLLYVAMTRAQALLTMTFPIMQSRDQGESIITQFLPNELHHHVSRTGPLFDDRVIMDIASILRRPVPSQEDLAKALQSMPEEDSREDDIWPSDGSRKPFPMLAGDAQGLQGFGRPLGDFFSDQAHPYRSYSTTAGPGRILGSGSYESATTMGNAAVFSTSNMSLGFTTAGHQLKNVPEFGRSSSDPAPPSKKPKLSKSASAQEGIASFFSKPTLQTSQPSVESAMPIAVQNLYRQRKHDHEAMQQRQSLQSSVYGVQAIPAELSSHKLNFQNGIIKRPSAPLREVSPNAGRRYGGLYSSSPPPEDSGKRGISHINGNENAINQTSAESKPVTPDFDLTEDTDSERSVTKPATTMHKTTMSGVGSGGFSSFGSNTSGFRKTLGVRRTMASWNDRKHK
ncbi:ATP-dependent DNA helicase srs2 [Cladophialophora chaetospira]|uniref:DNA 3'-5' helicase n=1 Tax=Cladophialophora chaetospira TaxID=386627 RepID=A0AA38X1G4_9EURO|nr:ATP-dependent DNA helicase srs2 [Cladophialophora chaetospira]